MERITMLWMILVGGVALVTVLALVEELLHLAALAFGRG
jgi:hypothetical protein